MHMKTFILVAFLVLIGYAEAAGQNAAASDDAVKLTMEASRLFTAGKYKEAVPVAMRVVEISTKEKGADHIDTGQALRNLGFIQQAAGDKKAAEKSTEQALEIFSGSRALTDAQISEKASMLEMLGVYRYEDQKYEKAAEYFERAVLEREKLKADELELANSVWSLANLNYIRRNFKKSEPLFKRVLEIRARKLKRSDSLVYDVRERYHCVAFKNGNGEEARVLLDVLFPRSDTKDDRQGGPIIIPGGVVNGKAISLPKPPYPAEARSQRASGAVSVKVTIDEAGNVIFACAASGNELLWEASENAAYGARFSPTSLKGERVKVSGVITYNFVP